MERSKKVVSDVEMVLRRRPLLIPSDEHYSKFQTLHYKEREPELNSAFKLNQPFPLSTETGGTARLPHPTSQFRYQTLPSAMRASLIEGFFVLSSPYHSFRPTPSTAPEGLGSMTRRSASRRPCPKPLNVVFNSCRRDVIAVDASLGNHACISNRHSS
ncbi:hypothetical protein J6590_066246 [Homalodisca vitripennis]|nr:hypothetical protein J6590_066246 [Homalodisca vitripennis]